MIVNPKLGRPDTRRLAVDVHPVEQRVAHPFAVGHTAAELVGVDLEADRQ